MRRLAAAAAALLALAACSEIVAPPTIFGYRSAELRFGASGPGRPPQPIHPLDPDAPTPLLDQLMDELARTDPDGRWRGVTWDLSTDNRLPADWLLQTPHAWGLRADAVPVVPLDCPGCAPPMSLPACRSDADCATGRCDHLRALEDGRPATAAARVCLGHSERFLDAVHDTIVAARETVDIAVLAELPDRRFLATLRHALEVLARRGRPVTVRLLAGAYPTAATDTDGFLRALTAGLDGIPGARLRIQVGAMRSCDGEPPCRSFSWNHAKIVAVDGAAALVGGHNMWTRDYLVEAPVHDLSMRIEGSAARPAHRFLDALWDVTCAGRGVSQVSLYPAGGACVAALPLPAPRRGPGQLPVAAVARLAGGIAPGFVDQADVAEELMLGAARQTLRLSLQDLGFSLGGLAPPSWPEAILQRLLAHMLDRDGDVYLVLSTPDSKSVGGNAYSTGVPLDAVLQEFRRLARARRDGRSDADIDALLCHRLHLAPLRFGPDPAWSDDHAVTNHTKLWIVDERAFHIGSHNLYPVDLQDFGYVVEAAGPTRQLLADYWEPLWRASRAAAISGADAPHCALWPGS